MADRDDVLVSRLLAGDDDALGELFDRYSAFVLGVARRVTRNQAMAEDITQDVFVGMWTHPQRFDKSRGSLRAYLGVMAYSRAIDVVRSDTKRRDREVRGATNERDGRAIADAIEAASVAETVRSAVACLPEEQRLAVELAFFHGHTYREVATVLAIPEGTAKSRLRGAQARLGSLLAPVLGELV